MAFRTVQELRKRLETSLLDQGFSLSTDGSISLSKRDRESQRRVHQTAKRERIALRSDFIRRVLPVAGASIPNGEDLDVSKIEPILIEVRPNTAEEEYFRWWNLVWWSLPYERGYGRQMRFLVWDNYHHAVMGLIGLQSPILAWSVRDDHLGIPPRDRDYWVNQSMSAQRLGAVPPYNRILGGKLVALLATADSIRHSFESKYRDVRTLINDRQLPARLLFLTTTGAYGKSSVYHRLKYQNERVADFIGYSQGSGSFHVPNAIYGDLLEFLQKRGIDITRGYGAGPSRKLRLIDQALERLGYKNGAEHGITRAVYLFPLAKNLKNVIALGKRPLWFHRSAEDVGEFWKARWAVPRAKRTREHADFSTHQFLQSIYDDLDQICSEQEAK